MASATCENENCEKDSWTLRKHPTEYSGGSPTCPDCGTTRVSVSGVEPERPQQDQPQQANPPAPQQSAQGQEIQRKKPETPGGAAAEALMTLGDENAPVEQRQETAKGVFSFLGDAFSKYIGMRDSRKQQQAEYAQSVGVERKDNAPQCEECNYTFSHINPRANQVQCPECNAVYDIVQH